MAATNAPKDPDQRARRNVPVRGEWRSPPAVRGWQHGAVPAPPPKCLKVTRDVWASWFGSWFAAFWTPEDLAGLYVVGKLYDVVMRDPRMAKVAELRIAMDSYGMTPKGQQDRRWKRPEPVEGEAKTGDPGSGPGQGHYGHLRAVAKPAKAAE